jgi:hypothetical protein
MFPILSAKFTSNATNTMKGFTNTDFYESGKQEIRKRKGIGRVSVLLFLLPAFLFS